MPFSTYLRDAEPAAASGSSQSTSQQHPRIDQGRSHTQQTSYTPSVSTAYPLSEFAQQQGNNTYDLFSSPYDLAFPPQSMPGVRQSAGMDGAYGESVDDEARSSTSSSTAKETTSVSDQKQASSSSSASRPPIFQMPSFLLNPFGTPIGGSGISPDGNTSSLYGFQQQPSFGSGLFGSSPGGDLGKWSKYHVVETSTPSLSTLDTSASAHQKTPFDYVNIPTPPSTTSNVNAPASTSHHSSPDDHNRSRPSSGTSHGRPSLPRLDTETAMALATTALDFQQREQQQQSLNSAASQYQQQSPLQGHTFSPHAPQPIHPIGVSDTSELVQTDSVHQLALLRPPSPSSGLPIYSQSGFDMLPLLAYVAQRPNPSITLGPVDMSTAFIVAVAPPSSASSASLAASMRTMMPQNAPIVYASQTFCELTGYDEGEIIGQDCRFLQYPPPVSNNKRERDGTPRQGQERAMSDAVTALKAAIVNGGEAQVSLINYKKDGAPFVNRVSIVPVPGKAISGLTEKWRNKLETDGDGVEGSAADAALREDVTFFVGFQVDLNEQPAAIARRIREGKFYSPSNVPNFGGGSADGMRGGFAGPMGASSAERSAKSLGNSLRLALTSERFKKRAGEKLTMKCNASVSPSSSAKSAPSDAPSSPLKEKSVSVSSVTNDPTELLHHLLLEHAPDFVHVLSLKGHFLYVAPSVRDMLGYEPEDLLGRSVGEMCHPSDAVPVLRELKENSIGVGAAGNVAAFEAAAALRHDSHSHSSMPIRTVDLLFRMKTKVGSYRWVEAIGRLHVEPGKGRKAIVLSGRACAMPSVLWGDVKASGGLLPPRSEPTAGVSPVTGASGMNSSPKLASESAVSGATAASTFTSGGVVATPKLSGDGDVDMAAGEGADDVGALESRERRQSEGGKNSTREQEFWAMLCVDGLFLVAGAGVRDVLGWGAAEMIGRSVRDFIVKGQSDMGATSVVEALRWAGQPSALAPMSAYPEGFRKLQCYLKKRTGESIPIDVVVYRNAPSSTSSVPSSVSPGRETLGDLEMYGLQGAERVVVQFKHRTGIDTSDSPLAAPSSHQQVYSSTVPPQSPSPFAYTNTSYPGAHYSGYSSSPATYHPPSFHHPSPSTTALRTTTSTSLTGANAIQRDSSANLFASLGASQGSSWQYELQQLKFANDALRKEALSRESEVRRLKALVGRDPNAMPPPSSSTTTTSSTAPTMTAAAMHAGRYGLGLGFGVGGGQGGMIAREGRVPSA